VAATCGLDRLYFIATPEGIYLEQHKTKRQK
jgi:hypothetical protein